MVRTPPIRPAACWTSRMVSTLEDLQRGGDLGHRVPRKLYVQSPPRMTLYDPAALILVPLKKPANETCLREPKDNFRLPRRYTAAARPPTI